jgi:hypothetical protein
MVDFAKTIVSPQELRRLQTSRRYLDGCIDHIKAFIPLRPSELVFNLDETGLSDWRERRLKSVLVTADTASQPFRHPVDRGIPHQTLFCCVSTSNDGHCLLLHSASRDVLSMLNKGVRENVDL